jgi:hypothetical protein
MLTAQSNLTTAPAFLRPQTVPEVTQICEIVAKSDLVPKQYCGKPNNVFVAYCFGATLGLDIMQSVRNVCVINGIPHLYGNGLRAVVFASGECEDIEEKCTPTSATVTVTRKGKRPVVRTFTIEDAKQAGYFNRADSAWKHYPARMCLMRATNWALNDTFPDILRSVPTVEDYVAPAPDEPKANQITKLQNALDNIKTNTAANFTVVQEKTPEEENKSFYLPEQNGDKLSPIEENEIKPLARPELTLVNKNGSEDKLNCASEEILKLELLQEPELIVVDYAEKECLLNEIVNLVEKFKIPKENWQKWLEYKKVKRFSQFSVDSLLALIDSIKNKYKPN